MRHAPYPRYKSSTVEWLGDVPEHWDVKQLRYMARLAYGDALKSEDREEGDVLVYGSNGPVGSHMVANTRSPVIIVGRKGSFGKVNYSKEPAYAIDTTYFIDSRFTKAHLRWLAYMLLIMRLDSVSMDAAVPGLAREDAYVNMVVVPPFEEQCVIAQFLDRETAKLDTLITKKRELIEKLREKRMALISRTVTRGLPPDAACAAGLDPHPHMKASGFEWLGNVPEHWDVRQLRYVARLAYGDALKSEDREEGDVPVYGSNGPVGSHTVGNTLSPVVVVGRKGSFGKVNYSEVPVFAIDTTYFVDSRLTKAHLRWLAYLLSIMRLDSVSMDSAVPGLAREDAYENQVAVPPYREQWAIACYLDRETAKIDKMIQTIEKAIITLQEYRATLITAAVTGKIDVRGTVGQVKP